MFRPTSGLSAFGSKNILSISCIWIIAAYWIISFNWNKRWENNPIVWDVVSYYDYLPALFIYKDIKLDFIDKDPERFINKFWPEHAANGGKVIKTTMGLSYMYTPFFLLAHLYAGLTGELQDGFSLPYQVFLQIGTLVYLIIGFFFLRSLLLRYFSDRVSALTIITLFWGTNLLHYSTGESLLAHSYIFVGSCVFLWTVDKWHLQPTNKISFLLGITGGMLTIIRPTMILFVLFPLLFGISNPDSIKRKLLLLKSSSRKLWIVLFAFVIPGIPQLIYWKYITGSWFFFSYTGERFFWDNPHILEGLFGYRNGWLLYTPIMAFSIIGIFFMRFKERAMRLSVIIILIIFIYVVHSWWCWWYGGFGLRTYIDIYALLSLPLASFFAFAIKQAITRAVTLFLTLLLIALNLFQSWQFEHVGIHFDSMTKKAYELSFLKPEVPGEWWLSLQKPNYQRALKGLNEYYEDDSTLHHIRQFIDFEGTPPEKDSIYYVNKYSNSKTHSFILHGEKAHSPAITVRAVDLVYVNARNVASAKCYFTGSQLGNNEVFLVVSFTRDTGGIYYYSAIDLNKTGSQPGKWNRVIAPLETQKIESENDLIDIYVWSKNSEREIFVDDLSLESIYAKD